MSAEWLSVLPPVVAIAVVLWKREVILALFLSIFTAELLQQSSLLGSVPLAGLFTLERIVAVFDDKDNADGASDAIPEISTSEKVVAVATGIISSLFASKEGNAAGSFSGSDAERSEGMLNISF